MKKKFFITVGILFSIVLLFAAYRMIFCPAMLQMEDTNFSDEERKIMIAEIDSNMISLASMADHVKDKKIILAGEIHFQEKVMQKFIDFLDLLPVNGLILTLELPLSIQPEIDKYMNSGEELYIQSIAECSNCLPYANIIRWCYANKAKVKGLYAIDENRAEIILNRAFCFDTRNKTMVNRILDIQKGDSTMPILFYGGQLHCLQSGRYLYDRENREPIGSRLLHSFSKDEISTIIFTANKRFVSYEAWGQKTGVFPVNEQTKNLERRYFIHEPVKGAKECGEFFNYFVNIGDLN